MKYLDLYICIGFFSLFVVETVVFAVLIIKRKKLLKDGTLLKKPGTSFWAVFLCSCILILLPIAIPLGRMANICVPGCGVLGSFAVLKERLDMIKKALKEQES